MKEAAQGPLKGILEYTEDPIVSSDIVGNNHSSIFDSLSTIVMEGNLVKVVSWYDNEMGYSSRCVDLAVFMAKKKDYKIINDVRCKVSLSERYK